LSDREATLAIPGENTTYPMLLTDEEYEDVYREALRCLADDGRTVGVPHKTKAVAARHCVVDGRTLDDRGVLETRWGEEITRRILKAR
jgi:hypothetical protein